MVERKISKRVKNKSPRRTRKTSPRRTRKTSPGRTRKTSPGRTRKTSPRRTRKTSPRRTRKTSPGRTRKTSPRRKITSKRLNAGFFTRLADNVRGRFSPVRQTGRVGHVNEQELNLSIEEERRASIVSALSDRYENLFRCDRILYTRFKKTIHKHIKRNVLNQWRAKMVTRIAQEEYQGDKIPYFDISETFNLKHEALDLCTKIIENKFGL